jgi:cysteine-rich repeat protein
MTDGVQDAGEQCDDGNTDDRDGCTSSCVIAEVQSIIGTGGSGAPCTDHSQCASGACQTGACEGFPPGVPCIAGAQCVSGACQSGACTFTNSQVADLTGHAPAGDTGPAALAVMGAGAAAGWAWMRRRKLRAY